MGNENHERSELSAAAGATPDDRLHTPVEEIDKRVADEVAREVAREAARLLDECYQRRMADIAALVERFGRR